MVLKKTAHVAYFENYDRNNEQKIPAAKSVEGKAVVVRVIVLDTES